jgi:hypothetical protein
MVTSDVGVGPSLTFRSAPRCPLVRQTGRKPWRERMAALDPVPTWIRGCYLPCNRISIEPVF